MSQSYRIGRLRGQCVIIWRDAAGTRKRTPLRTSDPREAERIAPAVFAELTRPKGKSVSALWSAYVADRKGQAILVTMHHTWKALRDRFGPMDGDRVTIADCRAHISARRRVGIKDGTLLTELGHLRTVLRWAEKHALIERAPYIERPAAPAPRDRHLTIDEVRSLIHACEMPHLRLFVHLAYATAGRSAAILGLTWDRVDFDRGKINLDDPTIIAPHKGRAVVPMTQTLRVALMEAKRGAMSDYVIEWAGRPVGSVKKGLKAAATKAGLADVSPHVLRHSSAVRMAEDGVPMEEIAQFLGHSNVNITRRVYARFSPHHLRNAARALELTDIWSNSTKEHFAKQPESNANSLISLVGATGIEPVTPTMSKKRSG